MYFCFKCTLNVFYCVEKSYASLADSFLAHSVGQHAVTDRTINFALYQKVLDQSIQPSFCGLQIKHNRVMEVDKAQATPAKNENESKWKQKCKKNLKRHLLRFPPNPIWGNWKTWKTYWQRKQKKELKLWWQTRRVYLYSTFPQLENPKWFTHLNIKILNAETIKENKVQLIL